MLHGSLTLLMSAMQGRGGNLALYEVATSDISDDTTGSAIIRRIMVLTQAAAHGGASEDGLGEEADNTGGAGICANTDNGTDNAGTVLAGANTQAGVDHAATSLQRGDPVQHLLIPAKSYPPSRSEATPIDVDQFDCKSPIEVNQYEDARESPNGAPWTLDLDYTYTTSPMSM